MLVKLMKIKWSMEKEKEFGGGNRREPQEFQGALTDWQGSLEATDSNKDIHRSSPSSMIDSIHSS